MQDSLPAEKVFDTGGYLATFRHRAKMTIEWRFNKGLQEDQISRLTAVMEGSANGIFPHSHNYHGGFTLGADSPNLFSWNPTEFGWHWPWCPSYPSEHSPSSFSSTPRSSPVSVAETTSVHPAS